MYREKGERCRRAEVLKTLREIGLVPVLRAESVEKALALAEAIAAGGVTVLEVTMTVPGAIQVMRRLAEERPDILIGAGTVLDAETARMCILEGAQFVVSPALNLKTIEMCHRYSIAVLPGALTPTEIVTAWQAGADVVKVFPASAMGGAKYLTVAEGAAAAGRADSDGRRVAGDCGGVSGGGSVCAGCWARTWWTRRRSPRASRRPSPRTQRKYLAIVRKFRRVLGAGPEFFWRTLPKCNGINAVGVVKI